MIEAAFTSREAVAKLEGNKKRIEEFGRSGERHGLRFHKSNGRGRPPHLGDAQPAAMRLLSLAIDKDSPSLGATYQRHLSSVTHSGLHGLTKFLTPLQPNDGRPEEVLAAINVDARELAVELVVGPLCATRLAENLHWFTDWDATELVEASNRTLMIWARIGAMPTSAEANG